MRNSPITVLSLLVGGLVAGLYAYSLTGQYVSLQNGFQALRLADASGTGPVLDASGADPASGASAPAKTKLPPQVISAVDIASANIYLLNSHQAREYAFPTAKEYDDLLDEWRNYFDTRKLPYTEIGDSDLTAGLRPAVLILPSAVALSPAQRAAVSAFEKRGGSVLATWTTGSKDDKGRPTGYRFLHDQFGIHISGEITSHDKEEFLVADGDTPVASTLPSGSRMWLGLTEIHEHPLRVSGAKHVAGRFMNWDRTANSAVADEAVVYREVNRSRRVYFAFPESIWQYDQGNVYTLVDDVLNWLRRRPHAYLANWPYPYRGAQIIEMDTEQGFPNAVNLANLLDANGLHGTFYCVTSIAKLYPDVIKRLETEHEIAYHADVHDAFKGQPREVQSKRMDTMREEMTPLVADPSKLRGFRPPYELSDKTTESLLYEKGFGHILGSGDTDTMLPALSTESPDDFQKGLIVLPRTQPDDMNFKKENYDTRQIARAMDDGFDFARESGGLGVLSVHTQNFEVDSPVAQAVKTFLAHAKVSGNKTWIAPSGTIEQWWRNRSLFTAHLVGNSRRMAVKVTVDKPGLKWPAALVVTNPVKGVEPAIKAAAPGMPPVRLAAVDDYQTAIVFDKVAPGSYRYTLNFVRRKSTKHPALREQPASRPAGGTTRKGQTALAVH